MDILLSVPSQESCLLPWILAKEGLLLTPVPRGEGLLLVGTGCERVR